MAVSTLGTVLATHFSGFLGRRFPFPLANTYTSVASRIRDLSRNVILRGFCGRVPSCSILYSRSNDQLVLPSRIQHGMQATLRSTCTFTPLTKKVCPNMELKMHPSVGGVRFSPTLNQIRRNKPRTKNSKSKKYIPWAERILVGPQRKGVCVKVFIRKPKKPNSAQRKCALLRLSNGKTITAYIPREKGQLQEHGVVLFEGGRVQDCPGIKYKIIRGKLDMN